MGNLRTDELPDIALKALQEGYDTPSLRILAGLGSDIWEIKEYLKLTLKEMDIELPNKTYAWLMLIKYYIQQIIDKNVDPIEGVGKVIHDVLMKTDFCKGKDKKYAYNYIGFHKLFGLYYDYDDMTNTLVAVSDKYRKKRIIKIREEIITESANFIKNFDIIKIEC
ncbi:hypothetical protein [Clostridium sp.]|uniref:hypothetical protein n=1 Tax=Clostridium sp. TaxID=1506 RepID=UPI001A519F26|nr:hypothetical protein [Clostridium sp.]MBK5235601.1 hypothetical protein [Clostridium sp.]